MGEEGRVGILMCAGCAFVCLLLFVTMTLTQVAIQDRRLVSCADALAGAGIGGASSSSVTGGDWEKPTANPQSHPNLES